MLIFKELLVIMVHDFHFDSYYTGPDAKGTRLATTDMAIEME